MKYILLIAVYYYRSIISCPFNTNRGHIILVPAGNRHTDRIACIVVLCTFYISYVLKCLFTRVLRSNHKKGDVTMLITRYTSVLIKTTGNTMVSPTYVPSRRWVNILVIIVICIRGRSSILLPSQFEWNIMRVWIS